jgi:hypothetical protein
MSAGTLPTVKLTRDFSLVPPPTPNVVDVPEVVSLPLLVRC